MNYLRKSLIFSTPVARRLQELKFLLVILVASGSGSFAKRCTISDSHYCSYLQACGLLRRHVSVVKCDNLNQFAPPLPLASL